MAFLLAGYQPRGRAGKRVTIHGSVSAEHVKTAIAAVHFGWLKREVVGHMRIRALAFVCVGVVLALSVASFAEPQLASPADGKAMLERAIAALKANEAAALKAFNDEKNKDFRDRDLYVYCFSLPDGNITAYQSPVMIGTNVKELKIPPNNPVGQHAYDAVAKASEGEIVSFIYDFPKPGTKTPAPKETLEARVGKQACGVSYFKA
jgi:hypothetical protein